MKKQKSDVYIPFFTVCSYVCIHDDGKISVVGIFDIIQLPKTKNPKDRRAQTFYIVALIKGGRLYDGKEHSFALDIINPMGKIIKNQLIEIPKNRGNTNWLVEIEGLMLPLDGTYMIRVRGEGIERTTPLDVRTDFKKKLLEGLE